MPSEGVAKGRGPRRNTVIPSVNLASDERRTALAYLLAFLSVLHLSGDKGNGILALHSTDVIRSKSTLLLTRGT